MSIQPLSEPYPVTYQPGDTPRYAIISAHFTVRGEPDQYGDTDPYGITIEYYDKQSKIQGLVKACQYQVDPTLWPAWSQATEKIVTNLLHQTTPINTDE